MDNWYEIIAFGTLALGIVAGLICLCYQIDNAPADDAAHVWRRPVGTEPHEEDAICVNCGAWADSEGHLPCPFAHLSE